MRNMRHHAPGGAGNLARSRLSGGLAKCSPYFRSRLKAGCGQDCPPHKLLHRRFALFLLALLPAWGATFGRVVPLTGGASDIVLDEARGRLYLVGAIQNQIQIYSLQRQSFQIGVAVDATPLSAALSRDGKSLYVTCYDSSVLDVIDPDALTVTTRVQLPAKPEAVAVGSDGRVLITTTGSGSGANVLLLYDPSPTATIALSSLSVTPAAPTPPTLPPPSGRPFLATHSQLAATRDGSIIVGVNAPAAGSPTVFVYQAASDTVLRSRIVAGSSTVLSVSDDGTRFTCGPNLFDTSTLRVLAQQNLANATYPITPGSSFNLQSNQGGSVFSPDGQTVYSAFNIAPVGGLPAAANASQLTLNDPDNFLIRMGIQLPENLAGKMVISADGASMYALSDSGFTIVPTGTISQNPLAVPGSNVVLLTHDPCGVTVQSSSATVAINTPGRGGVTVTAQLLQYPGVMNQASPATAPTVRPAQGANGPQLVFGYNTAAARGPGTITPPHDFLIQSPQAINIPDRIRVYENNRDPDARGSIVPIPVGSRAGEAFPDLVFDQPRQRLYIPNPGLNRVEVYDVRQKALLDPIKVGQLPVALALTPDGFTLYVANSGSESISIVDPDKLEVIDQVNFPPVPFNSNLALVTPSAIAASVAGLMVLTSDGTLWSVVGNTAVPRRASKLIGSTPTGIPNRIPVPSSLAATPAGDYILLATSTGLAYLYDPSLDDFVAARTIFTAAAATGYIGPAAAGPGGQYFVVRGTVLNSALFPVRSAPGLVAAVTPVSNTAFAIFSPPPAPAANAAATALPVVQILDVNTGLPALSVTALEGPLTQVTGTARTPISPRTMAIDVAGGSAYVITASGLSIVPLAPIPAADRPLPNPRGAVNLASYQPAVAANGLLSIFGQNLGASEVAPSLPLPVILGGTCVTLNNVALPLFMMSPNQINAQIPPGTAAGSYPLVVHSIARQAQSAAQPLAVSSAAPAVLVDSNGQLALFHQDGHYVNRDNPANRDEPLTMYALGLGPTTGGPVAAGVPSPSSPLAVTKGVQVFFGNPNIAQAAVIVDWSGLAPGFIGLYQLNLRVPGFHMNGDALPVTIRVGGASSPTNGPVVPYVAVQ